jgi:hypothetical protein
VFCQRQPQQAIFIQGAMHKSLGETGQIIAYDPFWRESRARGDLLMSKRRVFLTSIGLFASVSILIWGSGCDAIGGLGGLQFRSDNVCVLGSSIVGDCVPGP